MDGTPEERKAVKYSKQFLRNGSTRIVVSKEGEAKPPPRNAPVAEFAQYEVVYIRDDGWMLGSSREHQAVAEAMWKGDWVGRLERVHPAPATPPIFKLTVYSQQGFEYEACTFTTQGNVNNGVERNETDWRQSLKPNPKGTSLQELREWMANGIDPDEV